MMGFFLVFTLVVVAFMAGCGPQDAPWQENAQDALRIVWSEGLGMTKPLSVPIYWYNDCNTGGFDWSTGKPVVADGCSVMSVEYGSLISLKWMGSYAKSYFAQAMWREAFFERYGRQPTKADYAASTIQDLTDRLASAGI